MAFRKAALAYGTVLALSQVLVDGFVLFRFRQHRALRNVSCPIGTTAIASRSAGRSRGGLLCLHTKRKLPDVDGDIEKVTEFYNDDAFGLIFLSASFVIRDLSFAASFLILTAMVSTSVSARLLTFQPVIPGIVAFTALALSKFEPFAIAAQTFGGDFALPLDDSGNMFEISICTISFVWGAYQQFRSQNEKN